VADTVVKVSDRPEISFENRGISKMTTQSLKYAGIITLVVALLTLATPSVSQAILIAPGFDLLETVPPTTFAGVPFVGVPLGSFNFPGIGIRNTGDTDTIIQRQGQADTTNPTPIPIEMVALQLRSANPFDPDGNGPLPTATYFATLQSARGGPASTGTITIGPITFQSLINVCFDLHQGALGGPIVLSLCDPLAPPLPVPWSPTAPPFVLKIAGVNDDSFFPGVVGGTTVQPFDEEGLLAKHFSTVTTPEPSTVLLLGLGLIALAAIERKRLFKKM
jgi:PEP-CTERM motif